jgi:hypothetical protein
LDLAIPDMHKVWIVVTKRLWCCISEATSQIQPRNIKDGHQSPNCQLVSPIDELLRFSVTALISNKTEARTMITSISVYSVIPCVAQCVSPTRSVPHVAMEGTLEITYIGLDMYQQARFTARAVLSGAQVLMNVHRSWRLYDRSETTNILHMIQKFLTSSLLV